MLRSTSELSPVSPCPNSLSFLIGSTIVMKAINTNEQKTLQRAISVAPRGKRAMELLEIRVGTQTISPFYWALESGSLNSGKAR